MKVLSEIKYNEEAHCYQHEILKASKLPYVSINKLEKMFMCLDHQVTQVSLPDYANCVFLTEVDC